MAKQPKKTLSHAADRTEKKKKTLSHAADRNEKKKTLSHAADRNEKKSTLSHAADRNEKKKGTTMLGGKATEVIVKPHLNRTVKRLDGRIVMEAVVIYGRMNPPTLGHERLVEAAAMIAEEKGGIPLLALSQTVNKKNPLTLSEKVELCEQAFGDKIWICEDRIKDPIDLLQRLSEDFAKVTLVTGSDGAKDFTRILKDYNGKDFYFESTEVVTVDRDFDSDELDEAISASALRTAVVEGDLETFAAGLPTNLAENAEAIFNKVKFGLSLQNITEETTLDKARKAIVNLRNRK